MRKGQPSRTALYNMELLEAEDKKSISFHFSGKPIDLEEVRKQLTANFPVAYVEEDKGTLQLVISLAADTTPDALVEKLLDATHSKLSYHYTVDSKQHGSKRVPELNIVLDEDQSSKTFYGMTVLDILSRRIDPETTKDPLKTYSFGRSKDGNRIVITPTEEVCENHEQAMQYGSMMMSHFKHHLDEAAHHIQLSSIDLAPPEKHTEDEDMQTISLVLRGDEKELHLTKWNLARSADKLRSELVPDSNDPMKLQLNVYMDVGTDLEDVVSAIRTVHQETGCHLPVQIAAAVIPEARGQLPSGEKNIVFHPATAMVFNMQNVEYDPVMVQALAVYASSYTKNGGSLHFPTAQLEDGSGYALMLNKPTALIAQEAYTDIKEAWTKALSINKRLKALLEHDDPEQSQGMRVAM